MSRSAGELWIIKAITLGDVRTLLVQIIIWRLFVNASRHRFMMIHDSYFYFREDNDIG